MRGRLDSFILALLDNGFHFSPNIAMIADNSTLPRYHVHMDISVRALFTQILFSASISLFCLTMFEWFRHGRPAIFSPKPKFIQKWVLDDNFPISPFFSYAATMPSAQSIKWMKDLLFWSDNRIDNIIGGDATLLIIFQKSAAVFFAGVFLFSLVILLPINFSTPSSLNGYVKRSFQSSISIMIVWIESPSEMSATDLHY